MTATRSILEKHFECVEYGDLSRDYGLAIVPLEGRPDGEVDIDAFSFTVRTMLPHDVKLVKMADGTGIAMSARGEYFMVFASKNWPIWPEGAEIPRLHPIRLRKARRKLSFWDRIIPKRFREYIEGIRCARSAGHSWRYSFYCGRAFRFLTTHPEAKRCR